MAVHQGPADGGVVHTDLYQPRRQPAAHWPSKRPCRSPGVDDSARRRSISFPRTSRISATIVVVNPPKQINKFPVPNRSLEA